LSRVGNSPAGGCTSEPPSGGYVFTITGAEGWRVAGWPIGIGAQVKTNVLERLPWWFVATSFGLCDEMGV